VALTPQHILFSLVLTIIAAAYAAVGQAGATGYIAAMGLAGFTPDTIRPAALALNTLVAAIGTARFAREGYIKWRAAYPFILDPRAGSSPRPPPCSSTADALQFRGKREPFAIKGVTRHIKAGEQHVSTGRPFWA
jgi:hypothetical protein